MTKNKQEQRRIHFLFLLLFSSITHTHTHARTQNLPTEWILVLFVVFFFTLAYKETKRKRMINN